MTTPEKLPRRAATPPPPKVGEALDAALARLRYGTVQLTVHDGKVVQIDVTERQRFP